MCPFVSARFRSYTPYVHQVGIDEGEDSAPFAVMLSLLCVSMYVLHPQVSVP